MPHKRCEPSKAQDRAVERSVVNAYVFTVVSRALARDVVLEDLVDIDTALPKQEHPLEGAEAELQFVGADEEMLHGNREEDEIEDWIVFEGDLNVVSEFQNLDAERSYPWGSTDAQPADCRPTPPSGSFDRLRRSKDRFAGVVKKKVAYVGEMSDKIVGTVGKINDKMCALNPVIAGMWDAADDAGEKYAQAGERYAQQMEEIVKMKAAVLSDMSRTGIQDVRSTSEKCSWKLQSTASMAADRSRGVRQDMESKLSQGRGAAWSGAILVSEKANAVSKAASGMRSSFKSAMQKSIGRMPVSKAPIQAS